MGYFIKQIISRLTGFGLLIRGFYRLSRKQDLKSNIDGAYDIANSALYLSIHKHTTDYLKRDETVKQMMSDRYGLDNPLSVLKVSGHPEGTLGYILHEYCYKNGYDPQFFKVYSKNSIQTDYHWISYRARKLHDIFHIVAGYPPTSVGEVGTFSFISGNNNDYAAFFIAVGALVGTLIRQPQKLRYLVSVFSIAYVKGAATRPLLGVKFEEMLDQPISEIRKNLGIPVAGFASEQMHLRHLKNYDFLKYNKVEEKNN